MFLELIYTALWKLHVVCRVCSVWYLVGNACYMCIIVSHGHVSIVCYVCILVFRVYIV